MQKNPISTSNRKDAIKGKKIPPIKLEKGSFKIIRINSQDMATLTGKQVNRTSYKCAPGTPCRTSD